MPRRPKTPFQIIPPPGALETCTELARLAPAFTWRWVTDSAWRGVDPSGHIRLSVERDASMGMEPWRASLYIDPEDDPWTLWAADLPALVGHVRDVLLRQQAVLAGALAGMGGA